MRSIPFFLVLLALASCAGASDNQLYIMTRYWSGTGSLEIASYLFADDGVVVRDPVTPADAFDIEAERAAHPNDVGTYAWNGDELTMTFGGSEEKAEVERDGDCFMRDMGTFCPVEGVASETLDGTYSGGARVAFGGGAASSSTTVAFKSDGTYTLDSAGSVASSSAESSVSGGATGGERGRYAFDATVLTLEPEGGTPRKVSTFAFDDGSEGEQPRRLYFGGVMLKRID